MPEDCLEIHHHIKNKIRRINNGYIVISSYADGCDGGVKYWVIVERWLKKDVRIIT